MRLCPLAMIHWAQFEQLAQLFGTSGSVLFGDVAGQCINFFFHDDAGMNFQLPMTWAKVGDVQ